MASTSSAGSHSRPRRQPSHADSLASVSSSRTTSSKARRSRAGSEEDEEYFSPLSRSGNRPADALTRSPSNSKRSPTTSLRNSPRRTVSPSLRAQPFSEAPSSPTRHWHTKLPTEPVPSLPAAFARPRTSPTHVRSVSDLGPPSPTSIKGKAPARHSYFPDQASITRPASSSRDSGWTRASQTPSSTDPFQYDRQSASESEEIEREFLEAIERRQTSVLADAGANAGVPYSLPTPGRISPITEQSPHRRTPSPTTPFYSPRSGASSVRSRHSTSPSQEKAVYRGSRCDSGMPDSPQDEHYRTLPVVSSPPVRRTNSTRSNNHDVPKPQLSPKALVEEFSTRWSLDSTQRSSSTSDPNRRSEKTSPHSVSVYAAQSRLSDGATDSRRMGRVWGSLSSESSTAAEKDLVTPRGSVSQQGAVPQRMARQSSIYSTPSLGGPDRWPGSYIPQEERENGLAGSNSLSQASQHRRLVGLPEIESKPLSLDLGDDLSRDLSRSLIFNPSNKVDQLPPTPLTATDFSGSQHSLTSDSVSETASSLAFALSPNVGSGISEEEKQELRRQRTISELVETERTFAQDMAVARDIWLARAKGKELGEIIAMLQAGDWVVQQNDSERVTRERSISQSEGQSPLPSSTPVFSGRQSGASAPPMAKTASATSLKSLNRLTSGFSLPKPSSGSSRKLSSDLGRLPSALSKSTPASMASVPGQAHPSSSRLAAATLHVRKRPSSEVFSAGSTLGAPLSVADCRVIFINLEEVVAFSETFLAVLQACGDEGETKDTYGEAFLSMATRLEQVYSIYCSRFGSAIARFEDLAPGLSAYSQECKELSSGLTSAWDLPSLLIKPVQRCLKYPLFLQSLLGCTPDTHADRPALVQANQRILKIAETINELKRRQELVGKVVKPRKKSDASMPGYLRKASSVSAKSRTVSGESNSASSSPRLSETMSKKFKKQSSRIKGAFAFRTDLPPTSDAAFDALVLAAENKQRAIYSFVIDAKQWSKSVRMNLVALLQLSMVWKEVYAPLCGESPEDSRSARTIEHFALSVVKETLEGPWHDVDQEIRQVLAPKISDLLDLFRNPRAVIAKRNQKLADCHVPQSVRSDKLIRESTIAFHAFNAQLLEELPLFLNAVETFFTAILSRFITLQVALHRVMAERWREYSEQCCGQLGDLQLLGSDAVSAWWKLHKPIVKQFDTMQVLSSDTIVRDVERRQSDALPVNLRSRLSSSSASSSSAAPSRPTSERRPSLRSRKSNTSVLSRQASELKKPDSSDNLRNKVISGPTSLVRLDAALPPLPPISRQASFSLRSAAPTAAPPTSEANRNSMMSASSAASSFAFSQYGTASSMTSPSTPYLETLPSLWLGATTSRYIPLQSSQTIKGYPLLNCEIGDIFDILEEQPDGHALVRKREAATPSFNNVNPSNADVGWLPLSLLTKLD